MKILGFSFSVKKEGTSVKGMLVKLMSTAEDLEHRVAMLEDIVEDTRKKAEATQRKVYRDEQKTEIEEILTTDPKKPVNPVVVLTGQPYHG